MMRLYVILSMLLIISCNKEQPELDLLNPQGEYNDGLDSVRFEWVSDEMGMRKLLLSTDNLFNNILIDTMLVTNSFLAIHLIKPAQEYFWKVVTNGNEAEAEFKTTNPLDEILSEYEVETLQIRFQSSSYRVDTTRFTEVIQFIKESGGLRVQHGKGYIDRLCEYSKFYEGRYIYSFPYSASNGSIIYIDDINQEIELESRIGGIGSGTIYRAIFKY